MSELAISKLLSKYVDESRKTFHDELSTDENKDYRRGFRAGVLFAFLQIKSDIGNMADDISQRNTDQMV